MLQHPTTNERRKKKVYTYETIEESLKSWWWRERERQRERGRERENKLKRTS